MLVLTADNLHVKQLFKSLQFYSSSMYILTIFLLAMVTDCKTDFNYLLLGTAISLQLQFVCLFAYILI